MATFQRGTAGACRPPWLLRPQHAPVLSAHASALLGLPPAPPRPRQDFLESLLPMMEAPLPRVWDHVPDGSLAEPIRATGGPPRLPPSNARQGPPRALSPVAHRAPVPSSGPQCRTSTPLCRTTPQCRTVSHYPTVSHCVALPHSVARVPHRHAGRQCGRERRAQRRAGAGAQAGAPLACRHVPLGTGCATRARPCPAAARPATAPARVVCTNPAVPLRSSCAAGVARVA
jgi:hypothetical protein